MSVCFGTVANHMFLPSSRSTVVVVLCDNGPMSQPPAIAVSSFDHVTIVCADLEATRRFYVNVLGMAEVRRPPFNFPGLWFQIGKVQIHATGAHAGGGKAGWADRGNTGVTRGHHIAFAITDMTEALKLVEAHGVRIASPLQRRPDGYQQLFLYDPDGHLVELVSE